MTTDPGSAGQRKLPPSLNRAAQGDVLASVPSTAIPRGDLPPHPPGDVRWKGEDIGHPVTASGENAADEAFIRALYAEHGGALLRYALHLTGGDRQRAEDLVQETIVRAWRHPEALADRPARPWLFAVARNLAVDAYRARQSRPPEVGQAAFDTLPAHDDADRTLESWAVAEALASLRPDHRTVIIETYY